MQITFLSPALAQTGGCRVIAIYAEKLLARGHDVTVVARKPRAPSQARRLINRLRGTFRTPDPNRKRYFENIAERVVEFDRVGPPLPKDFPDADIIIATWWRTAFEVCTLPPQKGRKVYFVQGYEVFDTLPWDLSSGSYHLPLKKITISSHLKSVMAQNYDDPDVPVVENSVDTSQFDAPPRDKNTRPTVGLLYAPRGKFKGLDVALEAVRIARETLPELRVVAFGTSSLLDAFPLPPDSIFRQSPPQKEIRNLYAQCDVWLCGSRSEGFHLPPLEAMACRTPVVTTRIGGAIEVVTEGVNGHITDIEDAPALATRLVEVLSKSPEDWREMSEAAHARAHAYSWDDATDAFEGALLDIAQGSR